MLNAYKSKYTGEQIDEAVGKSLSINSSATDIDTAVDKVLNNKKYLHIVKFIYHATAYDYENTISFIRDTNVTFEGSNYLTNINVQTYIKRLIQEGYILRMFIFTNGSEYQEGNSILKLDIDSNNGNLYAYGRANVFSPQFIEIVVNVTEL